MPWGLERWHGGGDLHVITCSCYGRQPLLRSARRRDLFLKVLEQVRRRYQSVVIGYVVTETEASESDNFPIVIGRTRPGLEPRETLMG